MPSLPSVRHGSTRALVGLVATAAALSLAAPDAAAQYSYVWTEGPAGGTQCPVDTPSFSDAIGTVALVARCHVTGPHDPTNPFSGAGPFWEGSAESSNAHGVLRADAATRTLGNDPSIGIGLTQGGFGQAQTAWKDVLTVGPGPVLPA